MNSQHGIPYYLDDGGWCPNNPDVPLLIYRQVADGNGEELAEWFERCFTANGWPPAWRYTIYDFAHFHPNTHEVIGAFRGSAIIRLGDSAGEEFDLNAGDAVLIPAGVSHQRIRGTRDFISVGAYPEGFEPDYVRKGENDGGDYLATVRSVPRPAADPVYGGPLWT